MVISVRTEEVDGDLVVVKEARTDGDVARLSREATMLTRGRHPGVVELLAVEDRAIRLRHGGTPLSRLGVLPLDQAAGLLSAVADIVHALHRQGVTHGDLDADHVLVDQRGRPRLCGFGLAGEHTPQRAAEDVAALGRLLSALLRISEGETWTNPPSGLRSRSRRRHARRELEAVASRAARSDPQQRPTARQLAKAIHAAVPEQSLPGPHAAREPTATSSFAEIPADIDPTADLGWTTDDLSFLASQDHDESDQDLESVVAPSAVPGVERARVAVDPGPERSDDVRPSVPLPDTAARGGRPRERRRSLVRIVVLVVILIVGIVAGVVGAKALDPFGGDDAGPGTEDSTDSTDSTDALETTTTVRPALANATTWPERCDVPDPAGPDVDGDGCPDTIELDGRQASVGSVTVTLGDEGDLVALADWNCDAIATPALLRPSTGEVFVFPRWSFDEPLEVDATTVVPDATGISAGAGPCPVPLVTTPSGPVAVEVQR